MSPRVARFSPAMLALCLVVPFTSGCRDSHPAHPATASQTPAAAAAAPETNVPPVVYSGMQSGPLDSTNQWRTYEARGVIREIPADQTTVTVRHEEIPGFMPRMTMAFNLKNPKELAGLAAGDIITFRVIAGEQDSWIEGLAKADTNAPAARVQRDPSSYALLHASSLKPGEVLPDATVTDELGQPLRLSDLRGRAVAFTFIFTRCPLPDYCPRMNQHFGKARNLLLTGEGQGGPTNWLFLSISFDPEFDRPEVLSRYAFSYRGKSTNRWMFASAPGDVMKAFSSQLDFRFADEGGTFLHNLRTVVLDPKGRVHRQFEGNRWKAEELAEAMTEAAGRTD